ncbi:hypothetical protein M0802_003670 [Mischocyttarus mexicanus]|nr:hypothetical protein M0802_003670 [Mischocyttarus mexicanus]
MILKDEDCIHNGYYAYNRLFFRVIGLWQFQTSLKQLIYFCFINFMIVIALLGQIYMLFRSELKLNLITKSLETVLPSFCFGFCYYNLLWNGIIMKKILHRIKCDWDDLADKPELVILKKYANVSRLCTVTIARVANYSMFVAIIQHACALLNIISWRIDERFKNIQQNFDHTIVNTNLAEEREWILGIIQFYTNTINFVDLIKSCYESIYLFEAFFGSIIIMIDYFYLFQILSFTLNTSEELAKLSYIIGSLFVIYAYYYLGQKLIDNHTDVYTKLCQIPFYTLSLKTQKMLLFLIMRSIRPCNLSIKGVIVISHYLFAKLMQTSYTYAMVFYNLQ